MHQIDHADTAHQTMCGTAILTFDQLKEPKVAFVLYAVIQNQKGSWPIADERGHQVPQATTRQASAA